MKNLKLFGLLLFISASIMGCSKEEKINGFKEIEQQLTGNWEETDPYPSYHSLVFSKGSVQLSSQDDETETIPYVVFSSDSIRCQRVLNGVSVSTKHQFIFDEKDNTLLIKNFIAGDETYPGAYPGDVRHFHDITFQKEILR